MSELFLSDNLVVRSRPCEDTSRWVVTFDNYGLGPGFDRHGFGEPFLQTHGISAIHVLGRGNDWYQYPEVFEALDVVRRTVAGADRVMTYGSSMGGYAAVRFAHAVGATSVLAFSPQYSLDPAKVPDDQRWLQDADRILWLEAVDGPIKGSVKPVIIYDSTGLDGWHGKRIGQDLDVLAIQLPWTAHPVAVYLDEIGMLRSLVFDVLDGVIDVQSTEKEALNRRRTSANYWGELALRQPASRPQTALGLARKAVEFGPLNGHALSSLAALLSRQRLHDEALMYHRRLVAHAGPKPDYLIPYADALLAAGQLAEASEVAREVMDVAPQMIRFRLWASDVLRTAGADGEAAAALAAALTLDPTNMALRVEVERRRGDVVPPVERPGVRLWGRLRRWWNKCIPSAA